MNLYRGSDDTYPEWLEPAPVWYPLYCSYCATSLQKYHLQRQMPRLSNAVPEKYATLADQPRFVQPTRHSKPGR